MLLGLDPGSVKMGYCIGTGDQLPEANALRFDPAGADLGQMLADLDKALGPVLDRGVTEVCYEAPILLRHDSLGRLRKTLNLGGHIEWMCFGRGIPCTEVSLRDVKRELAGFPGADKDAMVWAAQRLGVALPPTKAAGREDAADAVGVWMVLLRERNKAASARFESGLVERARLRVALPAPHRTLGRELLQRK